jgi:glycosyltransferase involved in cell wall biosynthesis
MLALHKGFVYLLRAARLLGPSSLSLRLIGGTVDRDTRRLFERERRGLDVVDGGVLALVPELHRAEILVLPTLHDGFGFVAAEAMAAGLPVIVTDQCGAAEWVRHGETGWVIPAGDERALAGALALALDRRRELPEMGRAGRAVAMRLSGTEAHLRAWVRGQHQPA